MRILAIRLSALGDVAMTVPVIDSLARQYPRLEITVLSKPFVSPLFERMPVNVRFQGVDLGKYKGIGGLFRLFRAFRKGNYDAVADLHDVLRTKVLRGLFALSGTKTAHIDKGRKEKKELTRPQRKKLAPLTSSFVRYADVFRRLGFPAEVTFRSIYGDEKGEASLFQSITGATHGKHWIGIAPFAAHRGKVLPESTIAELIEEAASHPDWTIFLFGGKTEAEKLEGWSHPHNNVVSLAGKLNLDGELALMSRLEVMVSMDSANMHLASLVGTPVVSVWGATHPYAGFMGWGQSLDRAVQTDLTCRPCSIFGNKPCLRGDYACLTEIAAHQIVKKIESNLKYENHHPA